MKPIYKKTICKLCAFLSVVGSNKTNADFKSKFKWTYENFLRPVTRGTYKIGKFVTNSLWGKHKIADNSTELIADGVGNQLISNITIGDDGGIIQKVARNGITIGKIIIKPYLYEMVVPIVEVLLPIAEYGIEAIGNRLDKFIMSYLDLDKEISDNDEVLCHDGKITWKEMREKYPLEYTLGTLYGKIEIITKYNNKENKTINKSYAGFLMALNQAICNPDKQENEDIISKIAKDLKEKLGIVVSSESSDSGIAAITEKEGEYDFTIIDKKPIEVSITTAENNKMTLQYKIDKKEIKISFHLSDESEENQETANKKIYEIKSKDGKIKKLVATFE